MPHEKESLHVNFQEPEKTDGEYVNQHLVIYSPESIINSDFICPDKKLVVETDENKQVINELYFRNNNCGNYVMKMQVVLDSATDEFEESILKKINEGCCYVLILPRFN